MSDETNGGKRDVNVVAQPGRLHLWGQPVAVEVVEQVTQACLAQANAIAAALRTSDQRQAEQFEQLGRAMLDAMEAYRAQPRAAKLARWLLVVGTLATAAQPVIEHWLNRLDRDELRIEKQEVPVALGEVGITSPKTRQTSP
jgi:hypothetical protein